MFFRKIPAMLLFESVHELVIDEIDVFLSTGVEGVNKTETFFKFQMA